MSSTRPRVVVWGDSHAARLYPGLEAVFGRTIAISQFTRNACPPVLDLGYEVCRQGNAWLIGQIARIRPDAVILFAYWPLFTPDWGADGARQRLRATIDALHTIGVGKIVVIGPAPQWKGDLSALLYQALDYQTHRVPDRLATGLEPRVAIADSRIQQDLEGRDVAYFSVRDFLCTEEGCLTHTPEGVMHLMTYDYGHFTTDGATLVAQKLAADRVLP
jgi:hypothetical protein